MDMYSYTLQTRPKTGLACLMCAKFTGQQPRSLLTLIAVRFQACRVRCRANLEQISKSVPNSGPALQVKVFPLCECVPSPLSSGATFANVGKRD